MKWKREIRDTGVWVVGALAGRCSKAKTEVHLFKNYIWPLKAGGYRMCLIKVHQRDVVSLSLR